MDIHPCMPFKVHVRKLAAENYLARAGKGRGALHPELVAAPLHRKTIRFELGCSYW